MQAAMGKWMAGVVVATALVGCGDQKCAELGAHMADLAIAEAKAQGHAVAQDKRDDIVKKTTDACNVEPPEQAHLECALEAQSTKAMKKCEGVDEDEQRCGTLAEHLADLALADALAAGRELSVQEREALAKKTKEGCVADMPPPTYLLCALEASSTKAVQECDFFKDGAAAPAPAG